MKTSKLVKLPADTPVVFSDAYPLDECYAARGEIAPVIDRIDTAEVPEPYASLLVHKTDMTSTLEKFYNETLHVEVITRDVKPREYTREVALVLDQSKKVVEFGAIKIFLDQFPVAAQQEILREQQPLGRILNIFKIPFFSRPRAFLRLTSDTFINNALHIQWPKLLYGRSNSLLNERDQPLAEIVEILPP